MTSRHRIVAAALSSVTAIAAAQEFPDLGAAPGLPALPAVSVDLNPMMLSLLAQTALAANPDAADLLEAVDNMQVRVYASLDDRRALVAFLDQAADGLVRNNWQPIVQLRDDGDIRLYARGDENLITGLAGVLVSDREAIFINVTGALTPAQLVRLANLAGSAELRGALGELAGAPR